MSAVLSIEEAVTLAQESGGLSKRGSHRLSCVAVCPRKWHWRFARGIEPKRQPEYLVEGTLTHLCLAYYRATKLPKAPAWFLRETLPQALARVGAGYPQCIEKARAIAASYIKRFDAFDQGRWTGISVEHEYTATLGEIRALLASIDPRGPMQGRSKEAQAATEARLKVTDSEVVSSRIDYLVNAASDLGALYAVDLKTVGRMGRGDRLPTWNPEGEYAVNFQFLLQWCILKCRFGSQFAGVIVERASKSPPYDVDRNVTQVQRAALLAMPETLHALVTKEGALQRAWDAARGTDELPEAHWWSCFSWGKPCEYRDLCLAADSPHELERILVGAYRASNAAPENEANAAPSTEHKEAMNGPRI